MKVDVLTRDNSQHMMEGIEYVQIMSSGRVMVQGKRTINFTKDEVLVLVVDGKEIINNLCFNLDEIHGGNVCS